MGKVSLYLPPLKPTLKESGFNLFRYWEEMKKWKENKKKLDKLNQSLIEKQIQEDNKQ